MLATAAVYVLAELNVSDVLSVLAKLSRQGRTPDNVELAGDCPVNHKFLLCAAHGVIKGFPETSLGDAAQKARREYLAAAAAAGLPDAETITVSAWDAIYHENDYRRMLPGKNLYMGNQPSIKVTKFPALGGLTRPELRRLLGKMRQFAAAALP